MYSGTNGGTQFTYNNSLAPLRAQNAALHRRVLTGASGSQGFGVDPSEAVAQALLRTGSADGFDEEDPHGRLRVLQVGSPFWMVRDANNSKLQVAKS